jgi:hypothetical protein
LKLNYTILSAVTHFVEKFLPAFSTDGFSGVSGRGPDRAFRRAGAGCRWWSITGTTISEKRGKTLTVVQQLDHREHFAGLFPGKAVPA